MTTETDILNAFSALSKAFSRRRIKSTDMTIMMPFGDFAILHNEFSQGVPLVADKANGVPSNVMYVNGFHIEGIR